MTPQERLQQAWAEEDAARAKWEKSGKGLGDFWEFGDAVHNREMAMYLAHDCYGAYGKCISCGCSKGRPCVSHQGSPKHQAELLERIANATEAQR